MGRITVGQQNDGEPATNSVLRVTLPEGGRFTGVDEWSAQTCEVVSDTEGVCRFWSPFQGGGWQFTFNIVAPERAGGGTFPVVVSADADEADYDPANDTSRVDVRLRDLIAFTNDADEGPGSLRQAILDSRVACDAAPCVIAPRASGSLLIQPRTALPELRGRTKVSGNGTVTLDGSLLPAGDGLRFDLGCEFRVDSMVIRNFKGHAIEIHENAGPAARPCGGGASPYPMTVTRNEIYANERGIVTKEVAFAAISGNVIRDNRRAGVFADGGYYVNISRNEIFGNGASGIYINASAPRALLPAGADVSENVIRDNGEWGIARSTAGAVNGV